MGQGHKHKMLTGAAFFVDFSQWPHRDYLQTLPVANPPAGGGDRALEATEFWKQALQNPETNNNKERKEEAGVYVGEGLPPVPTKLAQRIWRWEFIDMAEMLPELWVRRNDENPTRVLATRARCPITDLKTWLKAFATYVAIMAQKNGGAVPELMAYMVSIIRAEEEYAEGAWVRYDAAYRQQAAACHNTAWSRVNPSLFSLCFTSKAQTSSRCDLCLSSSHGTRECIWAGEGEQDVPARLQAMEASVEALRQGMSRPLGRGSAQQTREGQSREDRCILFNQSSCYFRACRFRHACMICQGPHPAYSCNQSQGGGPWKGQKGKRTNPY